MLLLRQSCSRIPGCSSLEFRTTSTSSEPSLDTFFVRIWPAHIRLAACIIKTTVWFGKAITDSPILPRVFL